MAKARTQASATIVNAIPANLGGAYGLELFCEVEVRLEDKGTEIVDISKNIDSKLVVECVKEVFRRCNEKGGFFISVRSEIPVACGLSSSNAVANGAVLAAFHELGVEKYGIDIVKIASEVSIKTGFSITGAFDDGCASYFGGYVLTDNRNFKIIDKGEIEELDALIKVGESAYTKDTDVKSLKILKNYSKKLFEIAKKDIFRASTINGYLISTALGYSVEYETEMLLRGARCSALSGTGSAVVTLFDRKENVKYDIKTKTSNREAKVWA